MEVPQVPNLAPAPGRLEAWPSAEPAVLASPARGEVLGRSPAAGRLEAWTPGEPAPPASPLRGEAAGGPGSDCANARTAGSPWHIQLRSRGGDDHSRVGSESSDLATPVLGIRFPCAARRAASASRPMGAVVAAAGPRGLQDSNVLNAVQRRIAALDTVWETTYARLEEKVTATEGRHVKFDLRLSELTGNVRGLSEEMQAQIRRVDLIDDRLAEWRHQMEEEIRQKYAEIEQSIQKVSSSFRVSTSCAEDAHKRQQQRLQKLEADMSEVSAEGKKAQESLGTAHSRLDAVETRLLEETAAAEARASVPGDAVLAAASSCEIADAALVAVMEKRMGDVTEKLDQVVQDSFDLHAMVSAQEEQLRTLRTFSDTREEHWRALSEQVERGDWTGKLEHLRQTLQEEAKQRLMAQEDLSLLARRLEYQEQGQEELQCVCQRLASDASLTLAVEECRARIEDTEARLLTLDSDLHIARNAGQLAPRVSALITQLRDLVPRVTEQEAAIQELRTACTGATAGGHSCAGSGFLHPAGLGAAP